ncbi:malonate decarboxylase acyl carrier protein [Xanthobacter oligotrophicus]|uniref:malonate decarboxylase acyl carrier protein n=1 Tax=Xanthobacter oligotrophicus TaxID=2607286 RepID=UPI0011F13FD8|nr:malonate decarboxylase acyl carrier protein [Xanthobacter oligotrophicus]MCG5236559.1 malonate decarboxylase acyl carrier protein [Xanthobacter oligotrophicus]
MERLTFTYAGGRPATRNAKATLAGVVGSGNLEVLVEPVAQDGAMTIEITTAAVGFGRIWQAVMDDFFARHGLGDLRISINDVGATPAVVSLRLDQAIETYLGGGQ